uniref:Uncharacterized protein n=1 Tax=Romanomermis culicivorax TaxID=13658 RepID=A0A915IGF4_ROMCU
MKKLTRKKKQDRESSKEERKNNHNIQFLSIISNGRGTNTFDLFQNTVCTRSLCENTIYKIKLHNRGDKTMTSIGTKKQCPRSNKLGRGEHVQVESFVPNGHGLVEFPVRQTTPVIIATDIHLKFGFEARLVETRENCSSASPHEIGQHETRKFQRNVTYITAP